MSNYDDKVNVEYTSSLKIKQTSNIRRILVALSHYLLSQLPIRRDQNSTYKAMDSRAIHFWRWQCNGAGKIVALPSRERNCLCIMLCDGNAKLRAIVAEISNHLIFGNDCRKLGGVVKEGQG